MIPEKKRKISATAILSCNMVSINDSVIEWLDAKDFNLADLAKTIGIDNEHKAKATVTIEIVEQPCELCGELTSGDKLCNQCGKLICDACAKTDATGRYCPICFDLRKQPPKV
jgi:formylmethanofuran dehydrogenase subunit E